MSQNKKDIHRRAIENKSEDYMIKNADILKALTFLADEELKNAYIYEAKINKTSPFAVCLADISFINLICARSGAIFKGMLNVKRCKICIYC